MTEISWLTQCHFQSIVKNDFNWDFQFSEEVNLRAECLWRLLEAGRVLFTSNDHGQKFGLPEPLDLLFQVGRRLPLAAVVSACIREGTLDLSIAFGSGHTLELIPDSSGYEAWQLSGNNLFIVATGGGRLDVFQG